jgi:hypothetical protein
MTTLRFGIKSRGTDPMHFQKNQQEKVGPVLRASDALFVYITPGFRSWLG